MLSSDILEAQFGPTEVDILYQDHTNRIIQTVSVSGGTTLELSWVTFDMEGAETFPKAHSLIIQGASMGKAFMSAGIPFTRKTRNLGQMHLAESHACRFGSADTATVVEVDVFVGNQQTYYCSVLETYSPLVNWPENSREYPDPSMTRVGDFSDFLDAVTS